MLQYLELGKKIMSSPLERKDRTDTGTKAVFGSQMRFDLTDGKLALLTTKKLHLKSIIHELIWMISGDTNIKYLQDNGIRIWDEWADESGELGPVYGEQWRAWQHTEPRGMGIEVRYIDQLGRMIETLRTNPTDRRMIVNSWNVGRLQEMKLPPCHMMFQAFSEENPKGSSYPRLLSLQVYQRSVDYFLGCPFNLVFYSILAHLLAAQTGHEAKELIHIGGDVHVYSNHFDQVALQLSREPMENTARLVLAERGHIDDYVFEDIQIEGYEAHPHIKGKVAV